MDKSEIKQAIIEYLQEPKPLGLCNYVEIFPKVWYKMSHHDFHDVWTELIQEDILEFSEGGKNYQPIMVSLRKK